MKKTTALLTVLLIILSLFSGCSLKGSDLTVGLITDPNEANENSINSASWSGITLASYSYGVNGIYSVPEASTEEAFAASFAELYDQGCRIIVVPSNVFRNAVKTAQTKYKDCTFICISFAPDSMTSNTVSAMFAENESGFVAGFAAAQTLKSGRFGAVFGMDVPSSRRYSGGFKAGVEYSNNNYGTSVTIDDESIVYAGSYNDSETGINLARQLFGSGIKCLFTDGGKTAAGVFEMAKRLRGSGEDVWVIGSGIDQFNNGIYEGNRSITLTSAVSRVGSAISKIIGQYLDGTLRGGKQILFSCKDDCIGIPTGDVNIPKEIRDECEELTKKIASGEIVVPNEWEELFD